MKSYDVYTEVLYIHTIEVDDEGGPDYAGQIVEQGEGGRGDCIGATVTKVVEAGDGDGDDLRTPVTCSRCGEQSPPGSVDPCLACWMNTRLVARGEQPMFRRAPSSAPPARVEAGPAGALNHSTETRQ